MSRPSLASLLLLLIGCGGAGGGNPDAGGGDASFACPAAPDASPTCAPDAGRCDFFLQCGCAAGDKCTVGDDGASCAAAGGTAAGQGCAADADCARGTFCAPFSGATRCLQFCDPAHGCPAGQACYVVVNDRAGHATAEVCGPTCGLVDQDCAASGFACYLSVDKHCADGEGLCLRVGSVSEGSACSRANDCRAGAICVDPGGSSPPICAKICDRKGGGAPCAAGACRELPGQTETGVCLP